MNLEQLEDRTAPSSGPITGNIVLLVHGQDLAGLYDREITMDNHWHSILSGDNSPNPSPTVEYLLLQMQQSLSKASQYLNRAYADIATAVTYERNHLPVEAGQYAVLAHNQLALSAEFLATADNFGYDAYYELFIEGRLR